MTKSQAGIVVLMLALAAGAGLGGWRFFRPAAVAARSTIEPGSPRAVAGDLIRGLQQADPTLIRSSLDIRDPDEATAVQAIIDHAAASLRFEEAADRVFGQGRLRPYGLPFLRIRTGGPLHQLTEVIDDDLAEVDLHQTSSPPVLHFRRVAGQWKITVRDTFDPANPQPSGPLTYLINGLSMQRALLLEITTDIDAGRFTSADQAYLTMNQRLSSLMRDVWYEQPPSTTAPTLP